jgi:hypothetical protein
MPKLHDDIRETLKEPQFSSVYELQRLRGILAYSNPSPSQIDMARDMIRDNTAAKALGKIRSVDGKKPPRKSKAKAAKKSTAVFMFDGDNAAVPVAMPSKIAKNKTATKMADYAAPLPRQTPTAAVTVAPKTTPDPTAPKTLTAIAVHLGFDVHDVEARHESIDDPALIAVAANLARNILDRHGPYLYGYESRALEAIASQPRTIWALSLKFAVCAEMLAPTRTAPPQARGR